MKSFLEHWKPVYGYEGLYEVSDFGDVRRVNHNHTGQTSVLKPQKNTKGYLYVGLCKEGKMKRYRVHRLVAQAFIPNPYNLPEVNHKDEDKTSNVVTNLEYCDRKYNVNYGTGQQRLAEALSKKVLQLTLDGKIVREWASTMECGRNGFNQGNVWACCNNKYGKQYNVYKGYRWVYAEDYYKVA